MDKSKKYYKLVGALTEDASIIIIPNGEIWEVQSWVGSANGYRDTHVALIWDYDSSNENILALTYGSLKSFIGELLVGDGVKKLAIVLRNDSLNSERLGAEYLAKKV